ncbi:phage tail protein [Rahnella victoriana]|uniref:Phage tail protein n=2 Tax=Rahnella victoriana TaxID=1510570 RepID=A0ABS0DWP0_9GAMM|nr:phage tail protein [Rahnella victoriana]
MSTFKSVVTDLGQARIAAAIQSGQDINITQMAVGDGGGSATVPVSTQTTLVKETYRIKLNSLKTDSKHANWIIAEAIIPASVGGFWMREMGLYAADGTLIAVSNMADTYKPTLEEGSGRTQTLRMVIVVTNTDAVSLTIDDSLIVATEEYVNDLLADHEASRRHPDGTLTAKGFVQLSNAVDSTSEVLAATPKAVKVANDLAKSANDNANGRLPSAGTAVAATRLATARKIAGVPFDGTADISIPPANIGALPVGGTAVAALKLATPRKISGVLFDGTTDINLTPGNIGAIPLAGSNDIKGVLRNSAEFQSTYANSYRIVQGNYGSFWRQDGSSLYLMLTNAGNQYGSYNDLRPIRINVATGDVSFGTGISVYSDGVFSCAGTITPGNYSNFDNRYYTKTQSDSAYMAKNNAYSKVETDSRYIYDVQRGSQALENGAHTTQVVWEAPAGCFMTGLNIRSDLGDCRAMGKYYRALMVRTASGQWRQVGN